MNIAVCAKEVVDVSEIKIDEKTNEPILEGISREVSDIEKSAVEEAIKIKEEYGGKITVLTVGSVENMENIKELLAMGADEAVINPAAANQFEENVSVGDTLTVALLGGQQTEVEVVGITDDSEGLSPFEGFESSPRVYVPTDPYYTERAAGIGFGGESDGNGTGSIGAGGGTTSDARFLAIIVEAESADQA
ncbi:MAG: hypothetical protein ACLFNY_05790, partial [Candidatus Aenigmatarchaeota archaeon]